MPIRYMNGHSGFYIKRKLYMLNIHSIYDLCKLAVSYLFYID